MEWLNIASLSWSWIMTQDFSGRILKVTGCSDWSYHTSFLPTVDRGNVWSCITWRGLGFEEEPARCWRYWCPGLVTCLHETRMWQIYTTVWRTSKLVSSFRLMNFESYFIDVIYVISFFYSIPCLWDNWKTSQNSWVTEAVGSTKASRSLNISWFRTCRISWWQT